MIRPRHYISQLHEHVGAEVTLKGWLYNKRSSGKVKFLIVRDGTGLCQCVMVKAALPEEVFALADQLLWRSRARSKPIRVRWAGMNWKSPVSR
jgi:asparaginyl-tRNA synthetase